jgi:biotin carboxyl carrier protein
MENMIKSPVDGVIKKVNTIKGQAVEKGMILLEFN